MANTYDDCVVNKIIDGKQLMVVWHMDDLKVSHVDNKLMENFIELMEAEFSKETLLTIS